MSSQIQTTCPGCAATIKAPIQLLGHTRKCPGCKYPVLIRRPPLQDSGPLLVHDSWIGEPLIEGVVRADEKVVLLVDDDRELNDGLKIVLERHGHQVIQAFDGAEAREMVRRHQPDLMVLDLQLPRVSGYGVLQYVRTQPGATPVIMITGKEGGQHRLNAEYLGVIDYLKKPFAIDRFLASVEKGLAGEGAAPARVS
jgi:CheY-like chemotaxis protein